MIVEYIGQGLYDDENFTCGNHICSALKSDFYTEINFFVAFLRRTGLAEIVKFLKKAKDDNKNITFYIGIDQKVTSKQALEKLLELNIPAYIYNSISYIYHPKVYLFEGKDKNRVIIGSSNFTNNGLFNNVEASVLLDFTSQDKSGTKFLNQLKDYFSPLLDFDDPNLTAVTAEYIKELDDKGLLSNEDFDNETGTYNTKANFDNAKKSNKNRNTGILGNIEISDNENHGIKNKQKFKITDEYLAKWPSMFEKLKLYKAKYNSTVVSKHFEDRTFFGWYQRQKTMYNSHELQIPKEHYNQLIELDFDFFKDGKLKNQENTFERWLEILKNALKDNENIGLSKRYTYKGETLGTFLQGISRANKNNKKLEERKRIEDSGFDFSLKSRNPKDTLNRLINDLLKDEKPHRLTWRTRFYKHISKINEVDNEIITKVEEAWELQFNEKPLWGKQHEAFADNTDEWKEHRKETGNWYPIKIVNGKYINLFSWVKRKLKSPKTLEKIKHRFNEEELLELRKAGFPI